MRRRDVSPGKAAAAVSAELVAGAIVLAPLAAIGFGPSLLARVRSWRAARRSASGGQPSWDPGRELRAERKARELLRAAIGEEHHAMYAELGFLCVRPGDRDGLPRGYGYLIYPHRPIVAFDAETGELLSEYCVGFPDRTEGDYGSRLPDADDVLAKWMSLHGDERRLIGDANMHLPGRQLDPGQLRRDLRRWRAWQAARARDADQRPATGDGRLAATG